MNWAIEVAKRMRARGHHVVVVRFREATPDRHAQLTAELKAAELEAVAKRRKMRGY